MGESFLFPHRSGTRCHSAPQPPVPQTCPVRAEELRDVPTSAVMPTQGSAASAAPFPLAPLGKGEKGRRFDGSFGGKGMSQRRRANFGFQGRQQHSPWCRGMIWCWWLWVRSGHLQLLNEGERKDPPQSLEVAEDTPQLLGWRSRARGNPAGGRAGRQAMSLWSQQWKRHSSRRVRCTRCERPG